MKRVLYILPFSFLLIMAMISCEKEIEFKGKKTEPLIVVNSLIKTDSIISARITKSKFFFSDKYHYEYVKNADVALYINNKFIENLTHKVNGKYISTTKANPRDTIELKIKVNGYKDMYSQTVVPENAEILLCDTIHKDVKHIYNLYYDRETGQITNDTVFHSIEGKLQFTLKIKDNPKENNYYRLTLRQDVKYEDKEYNYTLYPPFIIEGLEHQIDDDLLNAFYDEEQSQHLFTDNMLNGKEITLKFSIEYNTLKLMPGFEKEFPGYQPSTSKYTVNLQSINRDMYLYLKTIEVAPENYIFDAFIEPVQIYNNIENGIGVLGAYSEYKKEFVVQ